MNRQRIRRGCFALAMAAAALLGVAATAAPAVPAAAATSMAAQHRGCTPDIQVRRHPGYVIAYWTLKCVHSVQAFAYWDPLRTVFGPKVVNGTNSIVDEPSGVGVIRDADCAGYAAYNSAGQQVIRKVTYPPSGTGC